MALHLPQLTHAPMPSATGAMYRSGVPKNLAPLARVAVGERYRNDPYMGDVFVPAASSQAGAADESRTSQHATLADDEFAANRQPSSFLPYPEVPANSASSSTSGPQFPFKGAAAPAALAPIVGGGQHVVSSSLRHQVGAAVETVMFSVTVRFRVFAEVHALSRLVFEKEWRGHVPQVGELVVVQGDRGEDVGLVEKVVDEEEEFRAIDAKLPRLLRKASPDDVTRYYEARTREDIALAVAQDCAARVPTNVPISIVAVEYQADLQKLSLVFRVHQPPRTHPLRNRAGRGVRVDFRDLQRDLFKKFKCRIWLVNETELSQPNAATQ